MGDTITILLGDTAEGPQEESGGFAAPGVKRDKFEIDPQQVVDKLSPIIEDLDKASSNNKGSLRISEAEFCIGIDINGNVGIRPLGGVEAGVKTALKVILRRED